MSEKTMDFIKRNQYDKYVIVGVPDAMASNFSVRLNKPIFYPEIKNFGTFIKWNGQRKTNKNIDEILQITDSINKTHNQSLIVLNYLPDVFKNEKKYSLVIIQYFHSSFHLMAV